MIYANIKGRLGADAELKNSKNGNPYVTMRVATNSFANGEVTTTWVRVTWVGDRAVKMAEHMKKGSFVDIWGELRTSLYDTKAGEKAISYDLMADRVDFISGGSGNTQSNEAVAETGTFKKQQPTVAVTAAPAATQEVDNNSNDDLPF